MGQGRRVAGIAVVVVLALAALAGCGRPDSATRQVAGQSAPIAPGPATGTIQVWAMGTEGDKLKGLAADFMAANPGATVTVTPIPWSAAHDKIQSAIAAGTVPDVSQMGTTYVPEFAATGGLDPLPVGLVDEAAFYPGAWKAGVVAGVSYAVPWYVETRLMYYRKDIAAQAGATVPTTWEEFAEFGRKLQAAGVKVPLNLPVSGKGNNGGWLPFLWSAGGNVLNANQSEFTLNSDQALKATQYTAGLFATGLAPRNAPTNLEQDFGAGKVGSIYSGPWELQLLRDQLGEDFVNEKVGVFPMPRNVTYGSLMGGAGISVFAKAKNREGGWKFAQYLAQRDVQQKWFTMSSDLPAVQSAWAAPDIATNPFLQTFGLQLETASATPAIPNWEQIANVLDEALEQSNRGTITPEKAVNQMQLKASRIGTGL